MVHDIKSEDQPVVSSDMVETLTRIARGKAVGEILSMRCEQVLLKGHSDGRDRERPMDYLPTEARERIGYAIEKLPRKGKTDKQSARRYLVSAAALILAAIDRIDQEPGDQADLFTEEGDAA